LPSWVFAVKVAPFLTVMLLFILLCTSVHYGRYSGSYLFAPHRLLPLYLLACHGRWAFCRLVFLVSDRSKKLPCSRVMSISDWLLRSDSFSWEFRVI
jgi:hypothetical protein